MTTPPEYGALNPERREHQAAYRPLDHADEDRALDRRTRYFGKLRKQGPLAPVAQRQCPDDLFQHFVPVPQDEKKQIEHQEKHQQERSQVLPRRQGQPADIAACIHGHRRQFLGQRIEINPEPGQPVRQLRGHGRSQSSMTPGSISPDWMRA